MNDYAWVCSKILARQFLSEDRELRRIIGTVDLRSTNTAHPTKVAQIPELLYKCIFKEAGQG